MAPSHKRRLRIISWNVAGLRGLLKRAPEALHQLLEQQRPDILCLQETKLQAKDVAPMEAALALGSAYGAFWQCSSERLGHAGVLTLCRQPPQSLRGGLGRHGHADSGRVITSQHAGFALVNVYVPNSGDALKNLSRRTEGWDPALEAHVRSLRRRGPVIVAGDLNVAPMPIDVYDPKRMQRVAGFTIEERNSFASRLQGQGLIDSWRHLNPTSQAYTFFSWRGGMRAKGRGWRLDHFMLDRRLLAQLDACTILREVETSDHTPIQLDLVLG